MKRIISFVVCAAVIISMWAYSLDVQTKSSYDEGYAAGYDEGDNEGYIRGYNKGLNAGYSRGFSAAEEDAEYSFSNGSGSFVKITPSPAPSQTTTPAQTISYTVYITNTGEKYHRYGCQYLSKSCIAIELSKAITRGYTACSRCW